MQFQKECVLHGMKESAGNIEGRAFSSTTFHVEVDLAENSAGRSMGRVTRPFKSGDASEFDKWSHLSGAFPIKCMGDWSIEATKEDGTRLVLKGLRPMQTSQGASAKAA